MRTIKGWCTALLLATLGHASQTQILIGQTAGFSGAVRAGDKETAKGARLYIDAVSVGCGVNGQEIEVVSLNDKFDPQLALENLRQPDIAGPGVSVTPEAHTDLNVADLSITGTDGKFKR